MPDRTLTEIGVEQPAGASARRRELGVVVSFCRGSTPWQAAPIAPTLTVGRDESAELTVDDPGVSRAHVYFEAREGGVFVADLGSRNGTHVNGERVTSAGLLVDPGAVVRICQTLLVVVADVKPYSLRRPAPVSGLVGGVALDDARSVIDTVSSMTIPVLILGETGSGKEVVARVLHEQSGRAGEFVALNCASIPDNLFESELFGHSRGAFSGALTARQGLFRAAHAGTLFLDEIGELPAAVQAKLLRVLETQEVRPVGEERTLRVDVRVVSATNRDLDAMAEHGDFRSDLLHRLAGFRIALPPLRDRIEDVPALALHYAKDAGVGIGAAALERMMLHAWPGNVRELINVVRAASEIAKKSGRSELEPADIAKLTQAVSPKAGTGSDEPDLTARVSRALTETDGNVRDAAPKLGMSRSVLYETLRRLRIDPKAFRKR